MIDGNGCRLLDFTFPFEPDTHLRICQLRRHGYEKEKESSSSTHLAISRSRSIPVRPSVPFVSLLDGPQCLNYLNDCD